MGDITVKTTPQATPGQRSSTGGEARQMDDAIAAARSAQGQPASGAQEQGKGRPVGYSFATPAAYEDWYKKGVISKGEPYYVGGDDRVHYAGSNETRSRQEHYGGTGACPAGHGSSAQGGAAEPGGPELQNRIKGWGRELAVKETQNGSSFPYTQAGRLTMGALEPGLGLTQLAASGARVATSAGGLFPNQVSNTLGEWEKGANENAAQLAAMEQTAREGAGLSEKQWDWWNTAGAVASPGNWIPAGKAAKGAQWAAGKVLPAGRSVAAGAAAGATTGAIQPTAPQNGESPADERLKNAATGAGWGAVLGPVAEHVVAPAAKSVWARTPWGRPRQGAGSPQPSGQSGQSAPANPAQQPAAGQPATGQPASSHGDYMKDFKPSPNPTELVDEAAKAPPAPAKVNYTHTLDGEVKGPPHNRRAVGGHYLRAPNVRVTQYTKAPDQNGVQKGHIQVRDPVDGQWVTKKAETSFFPANWSKRQTREAIAEAFSNSKPITTGDIWEGQAANGMKIRGFYSKPGGEAATAWPVYKGDK